MGTQCPPDSRMKTVILLALLVTSTIGHEEARKPRLFYVSTSSSSRTISTASICFVSSNTPLTTCSGRRRRRIIEQQGDTQSIFTGADTDTDMRSDRQGRFFLYWITTTAIATSTSFTTTYSISSVLCTHPGANMCG